MDTQEILDLADRLGRAIAESPQAKALAEAQEAFANDADARPLQQQLQEQTQKIARLEHENKPIEVQDKHKLQELQDQVMNNASFRRLTDAQVEYVDLLRKTNGAIQKHTAGQQGPPAG